MQEGSAAVLDPDGMEELLDLKPEGTALYGLGYNDRIAEALAEGQIEGLVLVNEYDMGYQAVYYDPPSGRKMAGNICGAGEHFCSSGGCVREI